MIVSGIFLDVKSAYTSVRHKRLINTLPERECLEYLVQLIQHFLTDQNHLPSIIQFHIGGIQDGQRTSSGVTDRGDTLPHT